MNQVTIHTVTTLPPSQSWKCVVTSDGELHDASLSSRPGGGTELQKQCHSQVKSFDQKWPKQCKGDFFCRYEAGQGASRACLCLLGFFLLT